MVQKWKPSIKLVVWKILVEITDSGMCHGHAGSTDYEQLVLHNQALQNRFADNGLLESSVMNLMRSLFQTVQEHSASSEKQSQQYRIEL